MYRADLEYKLNLKGNKNNIDPILQFILELVLVLYKSCRSQVEEHNKIYLGFLWFLYDFILILQICCFENKTWTQILDFTDRSLGFCVTDPATNLGLAMWPLAIARGGGNQIPARWWPAGGERVVGELQGGESYLSVARGGRRWADDESRDHRRGKRRAAAVRRFQAGEVRLGRCYGRRWSGSGG